MPRTVSNNTGLSYTLEDSSGNPGTDWYKLEPNSIDSFGATIVTTPRNPISSNRQARKGTVTDLDSGVGITSDLTMSAFRDFIEGFAFASAVNAGVTEMPCTSVSTTTDGYTVAALTAGQADKMEIGTLIYAAGHTNSGNNGLKTVDADIAASATEITVAENLIDETPPSSARISLAGYQFQTASATWDWDATTATASLLATGGGTTLAALGLNVGQFVHVGSPDGSGGVEKAFTNSATDDMYGYARVKSISANEVVFDKVDAALQFDDLTAPAAVNILFGQFIRNVATTHADYIEQAFQFEATFVGVGTGGVDMYQYSTGNFCNQLSLNMPLADKATMSLEFIGKDTPGLVGSGSRKSGASSATDPNNVVAFNTSADIAKLRILDTDESGLTTDFKSLTFTINNNVTPEKVLANLGAKYLNTGDFLVEMNAELVFTNVDVIDRIRNNTTVTMDFILKNENGGVAIDLPSLTLGQGNYNFPENQSVTLNTTATAFEDTLLGTSLGISIFPVLP